MVFHYLKSCHMQSLKYKVHSLISMSSMCAYL